MALIKKSLLALLLLVPSFLEINMVVNASSKEGINVSNSMNLIESEEVSLIDQGRVSISNVDYEISDYMSMGYITLNMGYSSTYTITLANISQQLQYLDLDNVSSTYLQFELEAIYTGYSSDQYQWLSSNPLWMSGSQRLDLNKRIPSAATVEVWWNVIGQSGGAPSMAQGGLRLRSIKLVVEYATPIELYTPISNWNELPAGSKPFNDYESYQQFTQDGNMIVPDLILNESGYYDIYFDFDDLKYVANGVTLPKAVNEKEILLTRYFATTEYRFLWFFFDLNPSNPYDSDFLIWNLTTGQFNELITGIVYGMPYVEGNGYSTYNMAYTDLVIPWKLDSIVSVKMSYKYRYHYLTFNTGSWQEVVSQDLYAGALSNSFAPWWNPFARVYYNTWMDKSIGKLWDYDQIENITDQYDEADKTKFVNFINEQGDLNLTMDAIFPSGATISKLFLGQFDKFGSKAVEIKDVVMMEIRYMNDGIEYSSVYPKQIIPDPKPLPTMDDFWALVWPIIEDNIVWIVLGVGVALFILIFAFMGVLGPIAGLIGLFIRIFTTILDLSFRVLLFLITKPAFWVVALVGSGLYYIITL